jgi:murein DD-endopeptidase MepM/ murein hydrolase activator NlpD
MKGARIPVVGPMIVFTLTALDPDPETGGVGRGAFKAIGAGLGEFLGFGIPIPILGPIIGGLVGEVMGDAAYEIIVNKDPAAAGKKIMDAFKAAAGLGGKVIDWAKGLVGRFFDAMPKLKLDFPKWIPDPLGIRGAEVIHPKMLTPLGLLELPGMFMKAFLNPEKKEEEKAEDSKIGEGSSQPNANLPSSPQTTPVTPVTTTTAATVSGGGSDFWTLAAVAAMEDSDGQARADVAQSIYNRKASGAYGSGTIRELIIADKQYQPTWDYPRKNPAGKIANSEWHNITDAATAAAATGKDVSFIQQAAADIQNKQYQEEAKKFVGGRTDFTNYSKTDRKGQVIRSTNAPNNYFGWDWNYQGNTMGGVPNFNTTTTTQQSNQQSNPAVTPSPLPPQTKTYAILCYGTNDWSLNMQDIIEKADSMIKTLLDKGYTVVVVPPNRNLKVNGKSYTAPFMGVSNAGNRAAVGADIFDGYKGRTIVERPKYSTTDTLHLEPSDAKRIHNKYKPAIYVGDSNAVRIKGATGAGYANTATAVSGAGGQAILGQINSVPTIQASQNNQQQQAQQAQKQRIQELQQKISQAEALLQNASFAAGPLANITKQNLEANKAELAKLATQPQTPMMPPAPAQTTPVTTPMQTSGSAITRAGQTTGTQKGDMISGYQVTSGYGQRWGTLHGGIDIGTPVGTFVGLSVPVEIIYAGRHGSTGSGYGNVVDAWAPSLGLQFRLAHLNTILCQKGQKLPAGTALGKTGGAQNDPGRGSSTGPHLHFEVDNVKNGTDYGGLGDPSPYVQYLILSANGPATGAVVTTPAAVAAARQNAAAVSQNPSYSASADNTVIIPAPQQQQPVMMGGGQGQGAIVMGGSTREVVNSYYKKQLLGFLYKQG